MTPSATSAWPSPCDPVPQSMTISVPRDERTSMHDVLPPYLAVVGPGLAMEPRVPQKRTFMKARFSTPACLFPVWKAPEARSVRHSLDLAAAWSYPSISW